MNSEDGEPHSKDDVTDDDEDDAAEYENMEEEEAELPVDRDDIVAQACRSFEKLPNTSRTLQKRSRSLHNPEGTRISRNTNYLAGCTYQIEDEHAEM
jgi:hypothetical protein